MNNQDSATISDSYIRDVTFPSGYNANQNPLRIHYIAVLNGFGKGELPKKFNYCDLGCGNGFTLNMLAAMYPDSSFIGVDFNQKHIENAVKSAKAANLKNVTYYQEDFINLQNIKFKKQDYICCNGTFSWINEKIQQVIKEFVGNSLAEGGKFYVEYAAKPGKIQMDPLWHFLREMTINSADDSTERVKLGIKYLESLRKNKALFFQQNPVAHAREKTLPKENIASIAHNALTEWQALNHSDIAHSLEKYGIDFVGQSDYSHNHLELHIPSIFFNEINALNSSILRETLKDYILNRGLRRDIFIKNNGNYNNDGNRFDHLYFAAGRVLNKYPGIHNFANNFKIDFDTPIYKDILNLLNKEPMSVSGLINNKGLKRYESDRILHALHMLVAGEYIMPVKSDVSYNKFQDNQKIKFISKLSENAIKADIDINRFVCLPSRNTGQVEFLGPVMALFLKSYFLDIKNNHSDYVCDYLGKHGIPVKIQNLRINNINELKPAVERLYKIFLDKILPDLARLGIIK